MDRQFWKMSALLIAAGYASMYPGCFAQTIAGNATGQPPAKSVEYASPRLPLMAPRRTAQLPRPLLYRRQSPQ